eukprot:scaffold566_cov364-Pavlova_lutheri.AAC.42
MTIAKMQNIKGAHDEAFSKSTNAQAVSDFDCLQALFFRCILQYNFAAHACFEIVNSFRGGVEPQFLREQFEVRSACVTTILAPLKRIYL